MKNLISEVSERLGFEIPLSECELLKFVTFPSNRITKAEKSCLLRRFHQTNVFFVRFRNGLEDISATLLRRFHEKPFTGATRMSTVVSPIFTSITRNVEIRHMCLVL